MPRWRTWSQVARETLLTAVAVLGVICAAAATAAVALDVRPLVFRSGSMAPEIPTGSLALAKTVSADDVEVGDVVSVFRGDGARVTHRVVDLESADAAVRLTLKGDANAEPDPVPYTVHEVDRVIWARPGLGRLVLHAESTPVVFTAGAGVGALLVTTFRRPPQRLSPTSREVTPTRG